MVHSWLPVSGLMHEIKGLAHMGSHELPFALHDVAADNRGSYVGRACAEHHNRHRVAESVEVG
jgi:hypothetical protein